MATRASDHRQVATWCAITCAGVVAAQLVSTALWDHQNGTHVVWFPGAVLLGVLLATPRAMWIALLASGYAGLVATVSAFGWPLPDVALVALPNVALIPVVAWCMRKVPRRMPPLQDFRMLVVFTLLAIIALPAAAVALTTLLARFTALSEMLLSGWENLITAQALGYALYVPAWCSLRARESALRDSGGVDIGFLILLVLAIVMLVILWYAYGDQEQLRPLLCVAPTPIVIAAIFFAQMPGSSLTMFSIAVIAAHMTSRGHGPFTIDSAQGTTLALQLWTLLASISALAVAVLVEQRFAGRRSLVAAHIELRELAGRLIATQEQERAHLARDLHDDINQRLAAASIDLSTLRKRLAPEYTEDVSGLQDRIVALCDDVRQLSHQLHPSCLQHVGLRSALENLCRHPSGHAWPRVRVLADDAVNELGPDIALCFYRVAQEALANAVRHAGASEITLRAMVDEGIATLQVLDDGQGFSAPSCPAARTGIGITSMNERAKLLGGSFDISSAPGKGVDVCIRIPTTTM
ncbi:MASE1 domain-containing protein [Luteibacter aegosomatissinici]|uniref:MASE1 domain-containing protein n=1 Tax=Luteibacter aegosomatissinici TaxID=2911539 RepID=UPI001FF8C496|nr:MASE1 domain-containing protein [Luteibacter aegosomatissinici]UPG95586.1 MASE1 domain-containing protein [Luteibacter aegosomatissinici]